MDAEHPEPLEMLAGVTGEPEAEYEAGGDAVCWAHLVCPECGAIVTEGHRGVSHVYRRVTSISPAVIF